MSASALTVTNPLELLTAIGQSPAKELFNQLAKAAYGASISPSLNAQARPLLSLEQNGIVAPPELVQQLQGGIYSFNFIPRPKPVRPHLRSAEPAPRKLPDTSVLFIEIRRSPASQAFLGLVQQGDEAARLNRYYWERCNDTPDTLLNTRDTIECMAFLHATRKRCVTTGFGQFRLRNS